jgi:hypothetical protein
MTNGETNRPHKCGTPTRCRIRRDVKMKFQSGKLLKQLEVIRGSQATSLKRGVNENSKADDSNRLAVIFPW